VSNLLSPPIRAVAALTAVLSLTSCEYREVNGIGTRTADDEHPPQLDITSFDGCRPTALGRWRADGEVINTTDEAASYEIVVGFYDGETRLDQRSEWIRDLRPGERAAIDRAWWIDDPDRVSGCRLVLVNRFS
jgi:hypothetical protein